MEMIKVQSSNLDLVGYDKETKSLVIKFHNGSYKYFGVPKQIFLNLLNASSKGRYHNDFIKDVYQFQKIITHF